jgi:acetyltransferase-like isoleucine patch superfamily enzyme
MMFEWLAKRFLRSARRRLRARFDRTLPFGDYVSDRWEKAAYLGFGAGSSIYDSALVFGRVEAGSNVWVGPYTILDGSGGLLSIGDNCHVSAGVQIYTHDTVDIVVGKGEKRAAAVSIGNNCYIGPNAVLSMGITIGDNVVIGANSFVNRDVASGSRGFGSPFRCVNDGGGTA